MQFAILACTLNASEAMSRSPPSRCSAWLELTNAGGNQLSTDEKALPQVERNLAIAVGVIIALWLVNTLYWLKVRFIREGGPGFDDAYVAAFFSASV